MAIFFVHMGKTVPVPAAYSIVTVAARAQIFTSKGTTARFREGASATIANFIPVLQLLFQDKADAPVIFNIHTGHFFKAFFLYLQPQTFINIFLT